MAPGAERARGPRREMVQFFVGREAVAAAAPGRINQKKNVDTGESGGGVGGTEYVGGVLGAESLVV